MGIKRAGAEGYKRIIKKDGSADWVPEAKRASKGSTDSLDIKSDFATEADTAHLDDIDEDDFMDGELVELEADMLMKEPIDEEEVEKLLREDIEAGLDEVNDYENSRNDYDDYDDYNEDYDSYGSLGGSKVYDSYDGYSNDYDDWN